jgi:hypothetical protein
MVSYGLGRSNATFVSQEKRCGKDEPPHVISQTIYTRRHNEGREA